MPIPDPCLSRLHSHQHQVITFPCLCSNIASCHEHGMFLRNSSQHALSGRDSPDVALAVQSYLLVKRPQQPCPYVHLARQLLYS